MYWKYDFATLTVWFPSIMTLHIYLLCCTYEPWFMDLDLEHLAPATFLLHRHSNLSGIFCRPYNQYVGFNSEKCREWSIWLFSNKCWSCFLADVKIMNSRLLKWKKKVGLYELQSSVFNKSCQNSPKAFFWTSHRASKSSWRQIQTSLHSIFISFLFFINIIRLVPQHRPGFHQRY